MTVIMSTMRQQMIATLESLLESDKRLVVLLADISNDLFHREKPGVAQRVINLGIMEQSLISVGAGFALEGFIPVMHSFAPFLVERPFEQIKDDFCYQRLSGKFISNGASYDYSIEGMTHHGPGDVQLMHTIPDMQIVVPGTPAEFDTLFRQSYANAANTYYRISIAANRFDMPVSFGKLHQVKRGAAGAATVIAVGPMLGRALAAVEGMDVTLLYCATVSPFDGETLRQFCLSNDSHDIVLVEPYYEGALVPDICAALRDTTVRIQTIGVPHRILSHYGAPAEHDEALGLTPEGIRRRIVEFV
jgi:transketolase